MNTEKLSKNLGIIAAGLLIVNLALDLYDQFSRNKKKGQCMNEDAKPDENSNNDEDTQGKREEDNND